jgi:hypothetical protein
MEQNPTKKSWFRRHPVLTGFGILVVLIIIASTGSDKTATTKSADTAATESSTKTYQQVATFNGSGAKKSEPFMITGDRFKIAYDCSGDPAGTYCGAFVFKVGSTLPQAVMNSTGAVKDETIIYSNVAGTGEYYIDANVLGKFTMTIYDYK